MDAPVGLLSITEEHKKSYVHTALTVSIYVFLQKPNWGRVDLMAKVLGC